MGKDPEMGRYPGVASAYILKAENGDPITRMDGVSRVYAHFLPTMVSQPASDGPVRIRLIYKALNAARKYTTFSCDFRVSPLETEENLLAHWHEAIHDGRIHVRSSWGAFMRSRPRDPLKYEWFAGDARPLQKPWHDQEIVTFKDPNQSSTTLSMLVHQL
jgi:hypothetical protein